MGSSWSVVQVPPLRPIKSIDCSRSHRGLSAVTGASTESGLILGPDPGGLNLPAEFGVLLVQILSASRQYRRNTGREFVVLPAVVDA